ncbi:hypothetical protein BGZ76_011730 [Entomortierella beljakovae]|nr:hypothetical protein BGZ76_011730 [Entomortierella beljakovae]
MKATFIAASLALAASANAAMIAYNAPISGTVWTVSAGKTFPVTWRSGCEATDDSIYDIELQITNPANGQQVDAGIPAIGKLDCSDKSGSTQVTLPATIASGSSYSILVVNGGVQSYSALFSIKNAAVPAPSTTGGATTTAAPTTTKPANSTITATTSVTATQKPTTTTTTQSSAGALKVGSTAALLVVAAASFMF